MRKAGEIVKNYKKYKEAKKNCKKYQKLDGIVRKY